MTPDLRVFILLMVGLAIATFLGYVVDLLRLPMDERPKTMTLDRFGRELGLRENPGYAETEEENQ